MPRKRADQPGLFPDGLASSHIDYVPLRRVGQALVTAAGGLQALRDLMAVLVRDNIDRVIQTPKTGRRYYSDLQNSEKTYLGTALEIDLRSALGLGRGTSMDLSIEGEDVDVKFSQRDGGWMIPPEAQDKICILLTANDEAALFSFGLIVARAQYMRPGANRDKKQSVSAEGRKSIWWLIRNAAYPNNFWLTIDKDKIQRISAGRSGNHRMMSLFREVQDRAISRKVVEDVASQLDPTRRVRKDKSRGTRNVLEQEGIVLLSGSNPDHRELIKALGLPEIKRTEYLAHRFVESERRLAAKHGVTF